MANLPPTSVPVSLGFGGSSANMGNLSLAPVSTPNGLGLMGPTGGASAPFSSASGIPTSLPNAMLVPGSSSIAGQQRSSGGRGDGSEQRRYAIQQQLMLLIHAYKCSLPQQEETGPNQPHCTVRFCGVMKKVLKHMANCQLGKKCEGVSSPESCLG